MISVMISKEWILRCRFECVRTYTLATDHMQPKG
jgi:hypothetical protein